MTIQKTEDIKVLFDNKEYHKDFDFIPDNQNDIEYVEVTEINFSSREEIDDMIKALEELKKEAILVEEDYRQALWKYQEQLDKGFNGIGLTGYLKRGVAVANIKTITSSGDYLLLRCEKKQDLKKDKEFEDALEKSFEEH